MVTLEGMRVARVRVTTGNTTVEPIERVIVWLLMVVYVEK